MKTYKVGFVRSYTVYESVDIEVTANSEGEAKHLARQVIDEGVDWREDSNEAVDMPAVVSVDIVDD